MGRNKLPETMETISVRLPKSAVNRIDSYLLRMKMEAPFIILNRADAIRQLLAIGLDAEDRAGR